MQIGAIDIGGSKTIVAVVDKAGTILSQQRFATILSSWDNQFSACVNVLKSICASLFIPLDQLMGIGINCNGMVDAENGILLHAPFSSWSNVPVADWFHQQLNNPHIYIENDVNACALGELYFGWKQHYQNFLWMTVSTGVGGAIVEQSQLLRGYKGVAGEMGHLKVEYANPLPCPCGQMGCLEAHASGTAITAAIKIAIQQDTSFLHALQEKGLSPDPPGCEVLARAGNQTALEIYQQAGMYLGRGIAYAVNLLNPQAVILGGGVACALDLMLPAIRHSIAENAIEPASEVEVVYTRLGYETALIGAAALVLNAFQPTAHPTVESQTGILQPYAV